jgi:hypothetical protein
MWDDSDLQGSRPKWVFRLCDDCASHLILEYDRRMSVVMVKRLDPELRAAS